MREIRFLKSIPAKSLFLSRQHKLRIILYLQVVFLFVSVSVLSAQNTDSLPQNRSVDSVTIDTTIVGTVVIRRKQNKMKFVPRSVSLTNPVISFRQTKALAEEPHRFRVPSFWTNVNQL
ncbi:MAG TPA: hypothetical protein ENH60_11115, partial [Pricia sp.]|nr:hypothetical protein [Pricia sp.]